MNLKWFKSNLVSVNEFNLMNACRVHALTPQVQVEVQTELQDWAYSISKTQNTNYSFPIVNYLGRSVTKNSKLETSFGFISLMSNFDPCGLNSEIGLLSNKTIGFMGVSYMNELLEKMLFPVQIFDTKTVPWNFRSDTFTTCTFTTYNRALGYATIGSD